MKCRICGSDKKKILCKICSNMKIMGPFFPNKDSYVVACEECGSVYVDTEANQKSFTDYYASNYSKSLSYFEVFGYEEAQIYYNNIEKRISQYCKKNDCILEIGGGIGELAYFLKEKGYQNITVMEPSDRCISLCKEKNINTIKGDGFKISRSLINKFDFIIINHTLEHILDFDKTLKSAREMLKENGHMYIEVPDALKYADTDFVPYWFFTYEHIVHMCLESFDNLAKVFRFKLNEKQSYLKCNSYYVMYAIFEKAEIKAIKPKRIECLQNAVVKYILQCEEKLNPVISKLKGTPIILWGVGTSTAQLLNGKFDQCNVIKLVDSNPYRQNIEYVVAGRKLKIEDPSTIDTNDLIVILPLMYDLSIRKQIISMGLNNNVQSLIENYKK